MIDDYSGPEVYPPHSWVASCKALVPNEVVWALLEEWDWLQAWDHGFTPTQSVHTALLDVLAPEVGALHFIGDIA